MANQVAPGAAQDEHGYVVPDRVLSADQAGHQGDQDVDVQAEAWDQKQVL